MKPKHKVLIIGDSHTRKCSSILQNNLNMDNKVFSFVKPIALMKELMKTANEEVNSLTNDDVVIVWGGVRDISRNNVKEALKSIQEFVKENKELNVMLINSPHRHDLSPVSCVNHEVTKYNRQMLKIVKLQPHVKVIETKLDRMHFSMHGLHLNSKGKESVSSTLAMVVQQFFDEKRPSIIPIPWKDSPLVEPKQDTQDSNVDDGRINSDQTTQHRRICPARRNPDFLWI